MQTTTTSKTKLTPIVVVSNALELRFEHNGEHLRKAQLSLRFGDLLQAEFDAPEIRVSTTSFATESPIEAAAYAAAIARLASLAEWVEHEYAVRNADRLSISAALSDATLRAFGLKVVNRF